MTTTIAPSATLLPHAGAGPAGSGSAAAKPVRRPSLRTAALLITSAALPLIVPGDVSYVARLTTSVFLVMLVASGFTKVSEVVLTIGTIAALVSIGASSVGDVARDFTGGTLWLLLGAFVVASATTQSGLAMRLAGRVSSRATTVPALFHRVTVMLIVTAFLVPSTAGRAALMVPVFQAMAARIEQRSVRRGLAVLFPVVILLSAVASLLGAGAHIVTAELVHGVGGQRLDVVSWTTYGLPFAVASSATACWVVTRLFVRAEDRAVRLDLGEVATETRWTRHERFVTVVLVVMVAMWLTERVHGVPMWISAVIGAAVLLVVRTTSVSAARATIPFDVLFLMMATVEVGKALARTGAADWIASSVLGPVVRATGSAFVVVVAITVISLLAHLVVTSRTARASVLVPIVMLMGGAARLDITAIAFLSSAAAGYCLSSTASAKPMAVFSRVGDDAYEPRDLKRLSAVLLPVHLGLLVGFAYLVWPLLGMSLSADAARSTARSSGSVAVSDDREQEYPWSGLIMPELGIGPRWAPSPGPADTAATDQPSAPSAPTAPTAPPPTWAPTSAPAALPTHAPAPADHAVVATTLPPTPSATVAPVIAPPPTPPAADFDDATSEADDDVNETVDIVTLDEPVDAPDLPASGNVGPTHGGDDGGEDDVDSDGQDD